MRDHLTATDRLAPVDDKRERAIRYLREQSRNGYCLDARVRRVPARETLTVLDKWLRRKT